MTRCISSILLFLISCYVATAAVPTITEKTAGMEKRDGYFPLYWDAETGKMWLEIPQADQEFLYLESLAAGIGSNDIGLDRGQLGDPRIVAFERTGPKILLVEPNYRYRADSADAAERRAVEESFARSVLWGFELGAEENGRLLVDATTFFLRDAHGVIDTLRSTDQGDYRLDDSRSAFYLPRTKTFPDNTEVEVTLTFTGRPEGGLVRSVTPTASAVSVREHHSFIRLPGPGYEPRPYDPRAGFFSVSYMDYAAPLNEPMERRFLPRHRLAKRDPNAAVSDVVEPIVYYLDPGVPEPVRSALLDGARWWSQAFEAAGFRNGFRVEMLPVDADPMDVRYNVIQWVHRSTRGWSYGNSIVDPRTGEIIKGQVSLGSLRVRQDYLIAEALLAPYQPDGSIPPEMEQMALARLRQLAAHEVGHTLGLAHNYISSAEGRASVMDYPHPLVQLGPNGNVDLGEAYATGIGGWDKVAITYGYGQFTAETDASTALAKILTDAESRGLKFMTDQDARPAGSAHPETHLWDNGGDATQELTRLLRVRQRALERFSENNIQMGQPMATLEEALVPLYLLHRYQVEAVAKVLGGMEYTYALRGDGQVPVEPVTPEAQRAALSALLETITPQTLTLPERILKLIPPRPAGFGRHRELFANRTGGTFDPLTAAESAAQHTVSFILNPQRAARLVELHARNSSSPSLEEVISAVVDRTWGSDTGSDLQGEVQRTTNTVVLYNLMALASAKNAPEQVRAIAGDELGQLKVWLGTRADPLSVDAVRVIEQFEEDSSKIPLPRPAEMPPGQPI